MLSDEERADGDHGSTLDNAPSIRSWRCRSVIPLMPPLALAFPGEPALAAIDDQYWFGPDLLVAPVLTGGGRPSVTFPRG